jgi:hypothetical protein
MSSVIVVNHNHAEFPLIIGANRDDDREPRGTGIQILAREPHLIMGESLDAGLSWLAVNKHSLFAIITNQGARNPNLQGRGRIVVDALRSKSLDELIAFVDNIDPSKYSGFNLLFGNQEHVFLAHSYILKSMAIRQVPAGTHLITSNMPFCMGNWTKATYVHKHLANGYNPWIKYYAQIKHILASKDYEFRRAPTKTKDGKLTGYFTHSSSILAFAASGLARFKYHDRVTPREKRKEGEPFMPRYKDYIDMWNCPDGELFNGEAKPINEEGDRDPEDDAENSNTNPGTSLFNVPVVQPYYSTASTSAITFKINQ